MKSKKYILLVEDSKHDELLTLRALKLNDISHEIIICRDGAEALEWVFAKGAYKNRDISILPTVTLLDLKLPKIDGLQVLTEIRKNELTKFWPVVILTTSKEDSDVASSYESGANSFVQKPIDFKAFSDAIRQLGIYWLFHNQPLEKPLLRAQLGNS